MAISFNKIKDPKLGLLDKFTFGKFQMCRICDILEDNYEYVLWLHSKQPDLFSPIVIAEATQFKREAAQKIYEEEEVKPYTNTNPWSIDDWDDDIPF